MSDFNTAARIRVIPGGSATWSSPGLVGQIYRAEFFTADAPPSGEKILSAGGSFALSGAAVFLRERRQPASGSFSLAGAVSLRRERAAQASGSVSLTGEALLVREAAVSAGGQVSFSGTASMIFESGSGPAPGSSGGRNIFMGVGAKSRLS